MGGSAGKKNTVVGILAHVDAGKTTLSEAMLYLSGKIGALGRVDHRDSYLDTHSLERERGITIFSKQAILSLPHTRLFLLDTPGHVDFAAEMERTLPVLDYAVLVISGTDGVQAHTETLWRLLRRSQVPIFLFVTKMDLPGCDKAALMTVLQRALDENCVDFSLQPGELHERLALCEEETMERYLRNGALTDGEIGGMIRRRVVFPCFFGSGLKTDGVEELLTALDRFTVAGDYGSEFGAMVYKIGRDAQGNRLTYMKITGGELRVRTQLSYDNEKGQPIGEKVSQLRLYSGIKYETAETVTAGQSCAVAGLSETWPGQGLGVQADSAAPVLEPMLSYRVLLPPEADARLLLPKFMQLQEEDPRLHVAWNERTKEIHVQLMGRVQAEILKSLVRDRFDTQIELDAGRILYRETIADTVEGVGHFEPLRHYAEVHLLLEPLPSGSGVVLDTVCSEDELDRNWQRLILTHLGEKRHLGVLTGSPLTDVKITLLLGRAHLKHTEGGDFRQATYRAVRQGLMQAKSVLLEPYYAFSIELPAEQIGRAISDVRAMGGTFDSPEESGDRLRLEGSAPVSAMNGYAAELASYTRGKGRLSLRPDGYRPCKDAESVIAAIGYAAENDVDNPADSVFCAHGAGFNVKWDQVKDYMHLPGALKTESEPEPPPMPRYRSLSIDERELEAIMEREFGPIRRPVYQTSSRNEAAQSPRSAENKKEYLIVDGYNVIFAWEGLKALAKERLDLARERLMDTLSNYSGYNKAELVLVFDGYRTPGNPGSRTEHHNIHVAYTKDGETADAYIERLANDIGKNYAVRVVTSDNLIRLSALRSGVLRTSSKEFESEVQWVMEQIEEVLRRSNQGAHTTKLKDGKS